MGQRIIVKRYAEAFVDYARAAIGLPKTVEEAKALKAIMRDNTEFYQIISSPSLSLSEKYNFIDMVFEGRFSKEFGYLAKLAVEKQRTDLLFDMLDYIRATYSHEEEQDVVLKSAYPLDLDDVQKIKERLEQKLKKKLRLYLELDPSLIAGVQVVIGTNVIDGSLKRRLEELGNKIEAARMG